MTKIINQDGEVLSWVAVYKRYFSEYRADCSSLEEALGFLYWGQGDGQLAANAIIEPSGHVIEGHQLDKALSDYEDELEGS